MKKMSAEEAKAFVNDRCKWKNYKSMDDYIEDVVTCLVYSPWHYSEESSRKRCKEAKAFIEQCYEKETPADDCASDVGYCCG